MNTLADQLDSILQRAKGEFKNADISHWGHHPAPGKWSRKEILGHLVDSAINNISRLVRATYEEEFKLIYDQDQWVSVQHHQEAETEDLFDLWLQLNQQLSRIFRHYPQNRLNTLVDLGKGQSNLRSVEFIMTDYITHLRHHLAQLFPKTS